MKLTAYVLDGHSVDIRPAPATRDWMDASAERFAYRCLPLSIANAHCWEILAPGGFTAEWSGEPAFDAVKVTPDAGSRPMALSHFGQGVLTFHVPCLFRTEPGYDLLVQGPPNRPKDAIAALTGVVETDWAPFTFTMNWLFTHPEIEVRFEKGEPICSLFPVKRGEIEQFQPEIRPLSSDPELETDFRAWQASRRSFNAELKQPGSAAQEQKWQRFYHRGQNPGGAAVGPEEHRTRVRLPPFKQV